MAVSRIKLERFTAFRELDLALSPGINVFIGANGTGKTHLLKVAYAACDTSKTGLSFAEKLVRVFLPSGRKLGRLVKRTPGSARGSVDVWRGNRKLRASFSNHTAMASKATVTGAAEWSAMPVECVFIPVKEMLSNGPGFRSLYAQREVHFEEIYSDLLDRAYRPALRGPMDRDRRRVMRILQEAIAGKVTVQNEEFFLKSQEGNLEFTLLAEGMRKLALLWQLVQNGTLLNGSVLFWDEPEANVNPKLSGVLMEILLQLQRLEVQVFLATHDYSILKELELRMKPSDGVQFFALYRDEEDGEIRCEASRAQLELEHSPIAEAFASLYDRELERSLGASRSRP